MFTSVGPSPADALLVSCEGAEPGSTRLVNSPPDSLATGDKVRIAGQPPPAAGASEGRAGSAGGEDMAAAPPSKPH
jgi:hypothetical protein